MWDDSYDVAAHFASGGGGWLGLVGIEGVAWEFVILAVSVGHHEFYRVLETEVRS